MALKDIRGNVDIVNLFKRSFYGDRLGHGYLFSGNKGLGKKFTAIQISKFLNCANPVLDDNGLRSDSCDICQSCVKIEKNIHPDVSVVTKEDKSSNIKIDQIRDLSQMLSIKPLESKIKVGIIIGADDMRPEAQNALLKTLEEPSENSLIILTSESPNRLFQTILSRVQVIKFLKLKRLELENVLISNFNVEIKKAGFLARLSDGSLGTGLSLNDEKFFEFRSCAVNSCSDYDVFENSCLEAMNKEEQKKFLHIMRTMHRDALVYKVTSDLDKIINVDYLDKIEIMAFSNNFDNLIKKIECIDLVSECVDDNVNSKIAAGVLAAGLF